MPPQERDCAFYTLGIDDVDRAVKDWFDQTVDAHVRDPSNRDGEQSKVRVVFSSGERWVLGRDSKGIRDKDGRVILPIMSLHRMSIDPMNGMSALGAPVNEMTVSRRVSPKTAQLADLDYSRPHSARRLHHNAVYDIQTIPYPFSGVVLYELTIQAQYTGQMNAIVHKIVSSMDFKGVPSFTMRLRAPRPAGVKDGQGADEVSPSDRAAFDARLQLSVPYLCGYLEGDIAEGGNPEEFSDQERIIRMTMNFKVPASLSLDPEGEKPAVQTRRTAFGVSLCEEEVSFYDGPEELDAFFAAPGTTVVEKIRR